METVNLSDSVEVEIYENAGEVLHAGHLYSIIGGKRFMDLCLAEENFLTKRNLDARRSSFLMNDLRNNYFR